jgi:hypothetical protein
VTLPEIVRTVRWMVRDTFRQSLATKLFWVMLAVTGLCTALCLGVRVTGDPPPVGEADIPAVLPKSEADKLGRDKLRADGVREVGDAKLTLAFGTMSVPLARDRTDAVRHLQVFLAGLLADTAGVLLALLWTAGFLPTFLEPQSATVLLAKPAPRWVILLGKYLGVVGFVVLQAVLFVGGTWAALGLATGVWDGRYWLAVPLLVINFGVFYSVSTFLAVCTRSTVAAAFGTFLFWALCWGMNYAHHRFAGLPIEGLSPLSRFLLDVGYWTLPKPLDLSGVFFGAMGAEGFAAAVPELQAVQAAGMYYPEAAVATSAGFAAVTLGLAGYELEMTDY